MGTCRFMYCSLAATHHSQLHSDDKKVCMWWHFCSNQFSHIPCVITTSMVNMGMFQDHGTNTNFNGGAHRSDQRFESQRPSCAAHPSIRPKIHNPQILPNQRLLQVSFCPVVPTHKKITVHIHLWYGWKTARSTLEAKRGVPPFTRVIMTKIY